MKISIITITYNSEKTIEDTIKSIQRQKYTNYEYIIIDGGSTDRTLEIVSKYKNIVTRIVSEPDSGISDAFNKGISRSTGDVIGIINSDDLLCDESLNIVADMMEKDTDVLFGNALMFGDTQKEYVFKSESDPELLRKTMTIVHPTTFVRKSAYEKYGGFDLQYKCAMDRELLLRMLCSGAKFQYVDKILAKMRLGGVNQRTYLDVTLPESYSISVKYGLPVWKAKIIAFRSRIRFIVAFNVRKLPFSEKVRKIFHSKNTVLDISKS